MSAVLSSPFSLTEDQLRALASRVGADDLPTVLAVWPRHPTIEAREAAGDRATRELVSANLISEGVVHPELVALLQTLGRPDRELAMRVVTPDGAARISLVRRGSLCVLARRVGEDVSVRTIGYGIELPEVVSAVLSELPAAGPADIQPVGAPLLEMSECLSGTHDPLALADRIRALGAQPAAAMLLGTALASRQAFAEIVYYALAEDDGRISRGPAAVAVFYTKRGRIIAAPSASPTGQLWTTLKAGSDHVFAQAIGQLVELSNESWGTDIGKAP